MNDKSITTAISWLRFPLIIGIVMSHGYQCPDLSDPNVSSLFYVHAYIRTHIVMLCTPLFYLFSGYLYFREGELNREIYLRKTRNRLITLLLPYLIWNFVAFLFHAVRMYGPLNVKEICSAFTWHIFWDYNDIYPYNIPLWFMRDLFVVSLFSPLIYVLMKKTRGWFLVVPLFLFVTETYSRINGFSARAVLFFSFGAMISLLCNDMFETFFQKRKILLCIALLISVFGLKYSFMARLFVPFGVMAVLGFTIYAARKQMIKPNAFLVSSVFFIYTIHGFTINGFVLSRYAMMISDSCHPALVLFRNLTAPFITVALCLAVFWLLKHILPKGLIEFLWR